VRDLVGGMRRYFIYAGLFSLAINVLLLVPAIYMLQVFDRVLSGRSEETLVMLSVGALIALAVMAALDVLRAQLLAACGVVLDRRLGPQVLERLLAKGSERWLSMPPEQRQQARQRLQRGRPATARGACRSTSSGACTPASWSI